MKKYLYYILVLPLLFNLAGCSEDEIMTYSDRDYILFTKYMQDSITFSFLPYPFQDQRECKIEVRLIGSPSDRDREYKISVMKEFTDAPEGSYELPQKCVLKAGEVVDSCVIILKKTPELSQITRKLTVRLEETSDFALGQSNRLATIINISNMISKPDWWNATIERTWLGTYSKKKYELFIMVNNGMVTLNTGNTHEVRSCTLKLKNYLKQQAEKGQTVFEEDGTEMSVAYIGG